MTTAREHSRATERYLVKVLQRLGVRIEPHSRVQLLANALCHFKDHSDESANHMMFVWNFHARCDGAIWPKRAALLQTLEANLPKSKVVRKKANAAFTRWWETVKLRHEQAVEARLVASIPAPA